MEIAIFSINRPPKTLKSTPVVDLLLTNSLEVTGVESVILLERAVNVTGAGSSNENSMQKFDDFYANIEKEDPLSTNLIDIFLCYRSTGSFSPNSSIAEPDLEELK